MIVSQENSIGKPLAAANWLACHHEAKLPERTSFAKRLATYNPKSIVDLGCASGLWLELLNDILPIECEFIGIDADEELLNIAILKSKSWERKVSFLKLDLENEFAHIPACDMTLAFNIFPYINEIDKFINSLSKRTPRGTIVVRQYDGSSIRFGPMPTSKRQTIDTELRIATENSERFRHYDLDRTFNALRNSPWLQCKCEFELFERISPFSVEFLQYYKETLRWTNQFLSEKTSTYLQEWIDAAPLMENRYFCAVDLIAILS